VNEERTTHAARHRASREEGGGALYCGGELDPLRELSRATLEQAVADWGTCRGGGEVGWLVGLPVETERFGLDCEEFSNLLTQTNPLYKHNFTAMSGGSAP